MVLSPIIMYHDVQNQGYVKTKVMSIKQTILGIERQSDLLEALYILENSNSTFPGMNNKFLEVLGPILRYYHAQDQGSM